VTLAILNVLHRDLPTSVVSPCDGISASQCYQTDRFSKEICHQNNTNANSCTPRPENLTKLWWVSVGVERWRWVLNIQWYGQASRARVDPSDGAPGEQGAVRPDYGSPIAPGAHLVPGSSRTVSKPPGSGDACSYSGARLLHSNDATQTPGDQAMMGADGILR